MVSRATRVIFSIIGVVVSAPILLAAVSQFTAVISLPNIATLRSLGAASAFYPNIIVQEYNSGTGYGGDVFTWDSSSTASNDSCTVFTATGVTTGRWKRQRYGKPITVDDCGAYSDGTNASATLAAFQAANAFVASSSNPNQTILMPGASYNLGSGSGPAVIKAASFFGPKWVGNGMSTGLQGTTITFTPSAEAAAFQFVGGGGAVCGCGVENVIFTGNSNAIGVELQGQGGANISVSAYGPMKRVVLLHNKLSGQFTEFDRMTINTNGAGIGTVLEYRVTSGTNSFHGSGLVGGTLNFSTGGSAEPAILIDAGAFPYNAPLSAHFFPGFSGTNRIVENDSATTSGEPFFYGNSTIEFGNATAVTLVAGNPLFLVGHFTSLGSPVSNGALYTGITYQTTISGDSITWFDPISYSVATSSGGNTDLSFPNNGYWNNYKIIVEIVGTGYSAYATADILFDGSGYFLNSQVNNVSTNVAGYGNIVITPLFSPNVIRLSATSGTFAAGMTVFVTLVQIGQGPYRHSQ